MTSCVERMHLELTHVLYGKMHNVAYYLDCNHASFATGDRRRRNERPIHCATGATSDFLLKRNVRRRDACATNPGQMQRLTWRICRSAKLHRPDKDTGHCRRSKKTTNWAMVMLSGNPLATQPTWQVGVGEMNMCACSACKRPEVGPGPSGDVCTPLSPIL